MATPAHETHADDAPRGAGTPPWLVGVVDRVLSVSAVVLSLLALVVVLGIVFVVFEANADNVIVERVTELYDRLLGPVATLFTPESEKVDALVNGGIGAGLYLVGARLLLLLQPGRRSAVR